MNREKKIFKLMEEIRVYVFTKWEFEKKSIKYWSKLLSDIPDNELEPVFTKFMKTSKFPPTPSGLLNTWENIKTDKANSINPFDVIRSRIKK